MLRLSVPFFAILAIVSGEVTHPDVSTTVKNAATPISTAAALSTTAATATVTEPKIGKWIFSYHNQTCIIFQSAVQMNFTYKNTTNQENYKVTELPIGNLTTVSGSCNKDNQSIVISWKSTKDLDNNFTMEFVKNKDSGTYSLSHIDIAIDSEDFPNIDNNGSISYVYNHSQFPTKVGNSYRCLQTQTLNLQQNNKTMGYIKINSLQFEAFITSNKTIFSLAQDCPFDTPDFVPITVGCALAGLVVIVLIAYLVGRRRNQTQGYLSM